MRSEAGLDRLRSNLKAKGSWTPHSSAMQGPGSLKLEGCCSSEITRRTRSERSKKSKVMVDKVEWGLEPRGALATPKPAGVSAMQGPRSLKLEGCCSSEITRRTRSERS